MIIATTLVALSFSASSTLFSFRVAGVMITWFFTTSLRFLLDAAAILLIWIQGSICFITRFFLAIITISGGISVDVMSGTLVPAFIWGMSLAMSPASILIVIIFPVPGHSVNSLNRDRCLISLPTIPVAIAVAVFGPVALTIVIAISVLPFSELSCSVCSCCTSDSNRGGSRDAIVQVPVSTVSIPIAFLVSLAFSISISRTFLLPLSVAIQFSITLYVIPIGRIAISPWAGLLRTKIWNISRVVLCIERVRIVVSGTSPLTRIPDRVLKTVITWRVWVASRSDTKTATGYIRVFKATSSWHVAPTIALTSVIVAFAVSVCVISSVVPWVLMDSGNRVVVLDSRCSWRNAVRVSLTICTVVNGSIFRRRLAVFVEAARSGYSIVYLIKTPSRWRWA
jgi:hypothetical protein